MKKFKIKSGDTVRVIAGDHKGSEGKILQKWNVKNTDNLRINTNNLSAGIYFATLKGAENKLVEKLVIID